MSERPKRLPRSCYLFNRYQDVLKFNPDAAAKLFRRHHDAIACEGRIAARAARATCKMRREK
jgi:hypothetical protein